MGNGTHCDYSLFGRSHCRKALSDTWLHFLEELYERDPDGLRDCVLSLTGWRPATGSGTVGEIGHPREPMKWPTASGLA